MKLKNLLWLSLISVAPALQAATTTYDFGVSGVAIPDGNPNGYAVTLNTGALRDQTISSVSVNLNISGGYNGDLYGYLVHSSGFSVLLNRVGKTSTDAFGYGDTGFNVTLAASGSDIHTYQSGSYTINGSGQLTGTWAADGRNVDPNLVTDTSPSTAGLGTFSGLDPSGTWTLFLEDNSSGGISTLQDASITITAVPEPVNCALGIFGALALGGMVLRRLRKTAAAS